MMRSSPMRLTMGSLAAARQKGLLLAFLVLPWLSVPRASAGEELPWAEPEAVGVSPERLRRIGDVVRRHIDAQRIAGAVTLVARKGRVIHFEAQGLMDIDSKQPMRKDTLFRMASSTKP